MAIVDERTARRPALDPPSRRSPRSFATALLLLAAAGAAWIWLGPFVLHPERLPPGPDMAWYQWRAELLTAHPPSAMVLADGPLSVFGGGYRIVTPLLGALVHQVGAVDEYSISYALIPGRQVLLVLALGAVAYRLRRDAWVVVATIVTATAALHLRPFVGYVDNVIALTFATGALWFLPDARREWPARVGVFLCSFLMLLTHPTTGLVFAGVVAATVGFRAVLRRSLRAALEERWLVGASLAGTAAGVLAWTPGIWGVSRTFRDAMHIPPYPALNFYTAAINQLREIEVIVPLVVLGVVALGTLAWRRFASDPLPRAVIAGLLPLVGILGFAIGLRYPYKRFLNSTVTPILLAGLGTWLLGRWAMGRLRAPGPRGRRVTQAVLGFIALTVLLGSTWGVSWGEYRHRAQWTRYDTRVALSAVDGYLSRVPEPGPIVFVVGPDPGLSTGQTWGVAYRGNWSQLRAGLPGRVLPDTHMYFGSVERFLEGRATRTGTPLIDLISRATAESITRDVGDRRPLVLLIDRLNEALGNERYLEPASSTRLGGGVWALRGDGVAEADPAGVRAARAAADATYQRLIFTPGERDLPLGSLALTLGGLLLLLVVPGLLAAPWFRISGLATSLGMVPLVSLLLNLTAAIATLAVVRRPLSPGLALACVGLACAIAAGLRLRAARLAPAQHDGAGQEHQQAHA